MCSLPPCCQVFGSLAAGQWDEEDDDSIDEDTATDGGEVSRAGSHLSKADGDAMRDCAPDACCSEDSGF